MDNSFYWLYGYSQLLSIDGLAHTSAKSFLQSQQKHHSQIMCHSVLGAIVPQYPDVL